MGPSIKSDYLVEAQPQSGFRVSDIRSALKTLEPLRNRIESSRSILGLQDDWDDEGSIGYKEETWKRATQFVLDSAEFLLESHRTVIDLPHIGPGPDGSIDIHWETKEYELLVNIPVDPETCATFYGDNKGIRSVKGKLDSDITHQDLLLWLKDYIK